MTVEELDSIIAKTCPHCGHTRGTPWLRHTLHPEYGRGIVVAIESRGPEILATVRWIKGRKEFSRIYKSTQRLKPIKETQ